MASSHRNKRPASGDIENERRPPRGTSESCCCTLEPSSALAPQNYVLLVSGTMNPPHAGHVRLGMRAAERLMAEGHTVSAICYVPVHDNYLHNKVLAKRQQCREPAPADQIAFPMTERCALLRTLIAREGGALASACHVLDYEHSSSLLAESPNYWAPKLPSGYLRTVPTTELILHFGAHSPLLAASGARLGVVFGIDNLAGMISWNHPERLLAQADLVLLGRAASSVTLGADPSALLGALSHVEVRVAVSVLHRGTELFGARTGSYVNTRATAHTPGGDEGDGDEGGDEYGGAGGTLFLLPPLEGSDEHLSSTRIRDAVYEGDEERDATLAAHGYAADATDARERIMAVTSAGGASVEAMGAAGRARDEWVGPKRAEE